MAVEEVRQMNKMNVSRILCIGNELLIGEVVNSNAAYIAKFLTKHGYFVDKILCIRDDYKAIADEVVAAKRDGVNYLFTTGGLGPTHDDITIESLSYVLGLNLVLEERVLHKLKARAEAKGHIFNDAIKKMAYLPEGAKVIPNENGAAPGADIISDNLRIFVLPGVPKEMKGMIKGYISSALPNLGHYYQKKIVLRGIGESSLAQTLKEIASNYSDIYIKSHPRVRLGQYYIVIHIYVNNILSESALKHVKEAADIIVNRFSQFTKIKK
ncbi:MAG: molybdopterin-binding protein [Nitrososphaeria archaeon]